MFVFVFGTIVLNAIGLTNLLVFTSAAIWVRLASSLQGIDKENDIYTGERLVDFNIVA